MTTPPTTPKPRRRSLQYGVRTMLVATFLACLVFAWMAYLSRSGRQQRAAATALQQRGASEQYDRRLDRHLGTAYSKRTILDPGD